MFIPEKLKIDLISYSRARISLVILLLNIILMFFVFLFHLLLKSIPLGRIGISTYILLFMILAFSLLLLLMKKKGWIRFIVNFYLFQSFSAITAVFLIYQDRNLKFLLILLPALAILSFTLAGFRNGLIWAAIIAFTHIGLLTYGMGHDFIGNYDQPMILLTTYFIILIAASTYEYITFKLMVQLDFERNLYKDKAHLDKLTQIPNRYRFDHFLDNAIIRAYNCDETFALVYIDLNGFKPINDRYGHNAGDLVLIAIADRLRKTIRHSDLAARLGGDEFAVVFQNLTEKKNMETAVDHIRRAIERPIEIEEGITVSVSGAMGILLYRPEMGDRENLISLVDSLMYKAKKSGRPALYHDEEDQL